MQRRNFLRDLSCSALLLLANGGIKPLQAAVAQYLLAMELSGSEFVEGVTLIEAGGDTTQIRFRNSSGAQTLKDDERQVFGANAGS